MNILVLTSVYPQPDDHNTVTPTVQYFCRKWAEAGHQVMVMHNNSCFPKFFYWIPKSITEKVSSRVGFILPNKESCDYLCREDEGVKVYRLPLKKTIPHSRFSGKVIDNQVNRINEIMVDNKFSPEVIITHWINPQVDLVRKLKVQHNAVTSLVFHNDCNPENIKKYGLQDIERIFDAIGCRNEADAQKTKELLGLSRKPFVCYSGIPDNLAEKQKAILKTTNELCNNNEFLYVGRLIPYKNVDAVIKALAAVYKEKEFKLHIVGVGAELENLKSLAGSLEVLDCIVFHGAQPRDYVFDLMKKCKYFTMISNHETFGMVYVEAMLAGCVTIASEKGGIDGVIQHGVNGFLSEQGNVEKLAKLYSEIREMSEDQLRQIRVNAINCALEFTDSAVAEKYLYDVMNYSV